MKNIKYFIIIGVLLILNGVLYYKLVSYVKVVNVINQILNNNSENLLIFERNFIKENENENLQLSENIKLIDIEGNEFLPKDVFKKNSIVFRYSELNCSSCINAEINILIKNNTIFKEDIFLIVYYQYKRDLYVYKKELENRGLDNIKMYLLPDNNLNIPMEKLNAPYYFCVNSNLTMTNFFIPQKDKPKLSTVYLHSVFKKSIKIEE